MTKTTSVAAQQKVGTKMDYAKLTNAEIHQEMLVARNTLFEKCMITQKYAAEVLVPVCEAIIARYKMQGVAAKDRPDGKPTVEAYFRSIGLNYNRVRSWIHRKRLQIEMFQTKKRMDGKKGENKIRHLTELEARLLGTASCGHDLVKAIEQGGNVNEAVEEFRDHAPTPERIEEYIERPFDSAADRLKDLPSEMLAKALMAEITQLVNDSKNAERVCIGVDGECPISYHEGTNCFVVSVQVPKQEETDDRQASKRGKRAAGGAQ